MLKNRMKVFYRPTGLKTNPKMIFDYLTVSNISANSIRVTNTSPYYISLSKVSVNGVNAKHKPPMIEPFTAVDIALNAGKVTDRSAKGIEIGLVNDYGATVSHVYPIQK
jgi:fimbrial chaperone protein